ncbi:Beta-barrel assembly-enhancing protease [termite gut metagenome]|uniref:Beta-barrel assembly-enhancing protease n=1 Tax=termite gut metagenome TaxID=433724 RepID=A0A5J4QIB0_9ZZZZ
MDITGLNEMIKKTLFIFFVSFVFFSFPVSAQTYGELSEQALQYIEKDSLEQAEIVFRQALAMEPTSPHNALIFSNIGTLQRQMQRLDEAAESYTYALNLAPYSIPILLNRATVYMEQGFPNRAYIDYCQVLDRDKKNMEALLMRAYIYMVRRDYNAARIDYNRLLEIDSLHHGARLGLATLNQREEKFQEAMDILEGLITEYPTEMELYMARAEVEQSMNLPDLALIDIDRAIQLNPLSAEAFLLRGKINLADKKKKTAKKDFEKAELLGISSSELREWLQQCH